MCTFNISQWRRRKSDGPGGGLPASRVEMKYDRVLCVLRCFSPTASFFNLAISGITRLLFSLSLSSSLLPLSLRLNGLHSHKRGTTVLRTERLQTFLSLFFCKCSSSTAARPLRFITLKIPHLPLSPSLNLHPSSFESCCAGAIQPEVLPHNGP